MVDVDVQPWASRPPISRYARRCRSSTARCEWVHLRVTKLGQLASELRLAAREFSQRRSSNPASCFATRRPSDRIEEGKASSRYLPSCCRRPFGLPLQFPLRYHRAVDLLKIQWQDDEPRFEVVYNLYSLTTFTGVSLSRRRWTEDDPTIDTVEAVWPAANWNEREVYDLFGITFNNHSWICVGC